MPVTARKIIAIVLAVIAVLAAGGGLTARTVDLVVNTSEPLQRILGPLATNEEVLQALPSAVATQLTDQIAQKVPVPAPLQGVLEKAMATSISAMINDPSFAAAWDETIENSRRDYVAQLHAVGETGTGQATLKLDLTPLLTSAYGTLRNSVEGSLLGALLPESIDMPQVIVDTNWPDEAVFSPSAVNRWLSLAAAWGWLLAAAGALLAGALFTAPRGFRGKVLVVVGATALLLAVALVIFGTQLTTMPVQGSELTQLVVEQLLTGARVELRSISNTLIIGGIIALLAAVGTWIWRRDNPATLG